MLRKCQPARWSAVMVSARWRIVLGSPVAGSAIVPAIQPAGMRFALGAGCPTPWLRLDRRAGFSASGKGGVPPLPGCTRLRVATSSSAVVPPTRPADRRFAPGAGQATPLLRVCTGRGVQPAGKACRHARLPRGLCSLAHRVGRGVDQSPCRYLQRWPHAALLHKAAFCEVAASRSQAPLVSPTAARPGGSTKQALCKVSLAGAGASAAGAPQAAARPSRRHPSPLWCAGTGVPVRRFAQGV